MIDGRQCLVIAVDDHVEVNGLDVWTLRQEEDVLKSLKLPLDIFDNII